MDPVVDLLDRQVDFILGQETDADFLVQVGPFLRALLSDPRLAVHLQDLESELVDEVRVLQQLDDELTPELIQLRQELVKLVPELDDSDAELPTGWDLSMSHESTLAYFDHFASQPADPINVAGEGGYASTLLGILQSKAVQHEQELKNAKASSASEDIAADDPDELQQWRWRLGNIDARLDHATRWLALRMKASAGLAYGRLQQVPGLLNPEPHLVFSREDLMERMSAALKRVSSSGHVLYKAVHGDRLNDVDVRFLEEQVQDLRRAVRRLHQELRHRLGTTRSRLALVQRFKARCESHDRARLVAIADSGAGAEGRLTAEFALYLFDQGLSPLAEPTIAGLRPDLLDPAASFYVEAKQYNRPAHGELVRSIGQVVDTVGVLQGTYAVTEAFVVIFRRGGPHYDLPDVLELASYRVHLVHINIAPPAESGSRQQERPVVLKAERFLAAAEANEPDGGS